MDASSTAQLSSDAINAALSQQWDEAIRLNLLIIEIDPKDLDAYNRLAFAYSQKGNVEEAKKIYNKVLQKDPYNKIAQKNLKKLQTNHKNDCGTTITSPLMFLEEPGKTKIVSCVNLAPPSIIATVLSGQEVIMKLKKHCIEIRNEDHVYLGALPDDISHKLIKYIQGGNIYKVVIRSAEKNNLSVFIREISRSKKYQNQPSFTQKNIYITSNERSEIVFDRPNLNQYEEEEE